MEETPAAVRIRKDIESNPVVLYMEGTPMFPLTPAAATVAQTLDLMGVVYRYVNLNDDPEVREAIRGFSQCEEFPHLYVRGKFAGGGAALREVARSGGFKALFDEAGIAAKALA
jgi:monothiol glutaredoxin